MSENDMCGSFYSGVGGKVGSGADEQGKKEISEEQNDMKNENKSNIFMSVLIPNVLHMKFVA
jgi:hypothetical protein